jgi:uncharacterized damage-inducible protein DinB
MEEQILNTWDIHNRINLYVLNAIAEEALTGQLSSKGRNVAEQFAHVHNVRLMWLQQSGPELLAGLAKIEKDHAADKKLLAKSLDSSAHAIRQLLAKGIQSGKIKGFKGHATAFLGYLISHESHHRGQIALALKQSGHPLDKKTAFGMWEWGVR